MQQRSPRALLRPLLLAASIWWSMSGFAASGIEVQIVGPPVIDVRPGRTVSVAFLVTNNAANEKVVDPKLSSPANWHLLLREEQFVVQAGSRDLRIVALTIPPAAPKGLYELRYTAVAADDPSDSSAKSIVFVVPAIRDLGLEPEEIPSISPEGSPLRATFTLTNRGNSASVVRLRATGQGGKYPVDLDENRLELASQEQRLVTATARPMSGGGESFYYRLDVQALAEEDTLVSARSSATVRIIPLLTSVEERLHKFPLNATARIGGWERTRGFQGELRGMGALSPAHEDFLEICFRGPSLHQKTILGQRDEYRARYSSKAVDVYGGDNNFMLSPLTEFGRYALGAGGAFRYSGLTVSGFANRDRFLSTHPTEVGLYAGYAVGPTAEVGVNYLGRSALRQANLVTVRGQLRDLFSTVADLEIGKNVGEGKGNAFGMHWSGREQWGNFAVRYIRAEPGYDGYYNDMDFKSAGITILASRPFRFQANFREDRRNLEMDTARYSAPLSRYYDAGIGYTSSLTISYRHNEARDRLPGPLYDRRSNSVLLQAGFPAGSWTFLAQGELGRQEDLLWNDRAPYARTALITSWLPAPAHQIGFMVEFERGRPLLTTQDTRRISGSINGSVTLGQRLQAVVHAYGSSALENVYFSYYYFDGGLEYLLPFGHRIGIQARHTIQGPITSDGRSEYLLEYTVPLAIPLHRLSKSGTLRGVVRFLETGTPILGSVLMIDGSAVQTNEDGEYFFPDVRPGAMMVQLVPSGVPQGFVPLPGYQVQVDIREGESTVQDFYVAIGATVKGSVLLAAVPDSAKADSAQPGLSGIPNAIVECVSGSRTERRTSTSSGSFEFRGLSPGEWLFRVLRASLPENVRLETDTVWLRLKSGESQEVQFRGRVVKRSIRIIEEGKVLRDTTQSHTPEALRTMNPTNIGQRSATPAVKSNRTFTVRISTWRTRAKADSEATRISKLLGTSIVVRTLRGKNGVEKFAVEMGPFASRGEAKAAATKAGPQTVILQTPPR